MAFTSSKIYTEMIILKILVINAGSSSLKYQLIDMTDEKALAKGLCERIGIDGHIKGTASNGKSFEKDAPMKNHGEAFTLVKEALTQGECKVIDSFAEISAVGHRVALGGDKFKSSVLITEDVIKAIEPFTALAPLHNPANIQGIRSCADIVGNNVPQVAVFDNSFHSAMPPEAYLFPIPYEYYEKYSIRRYGFHGTSHRFVSGRCAEIMGKNIEDLKIITCHLGNGCSITAVKNGKVADTSMGFTPLDGLVMGTRCGAIDPSIVTYLQINEGLSPQEIDVILNKKSGILGFSGVSSDNRDVAKAAKEGNERAQLAIKIQWYQTLKIVGSYAAAMNGVDAIVFTGGIGENTVDLRANVCSRLTYLGVDFDNEANEKTKGIEGRISTDSSKVSVFVIPTNEELVIARDTRDIVNAL